MKKLLLMLTVLSIAALCMGSVLFVSAQEKVVYVCEGGTGDGSSDASPLGSLADAYNELGDAGGRIVICGSYQLTATFYEPKHSGEVIVTQVHAGKDYRDGENNSVYIKSQGRRYFLDGPTTFENINFKGDPSATNNYILWIAQYNPITMGEGIKSINFTNTTIAKGLTVLGGLQSGDGKAGQITTDLDSKITVKSGKFIVVGFNRQLGAQYTGCAHINISGGEITTLYAGSVNSGAGGDANVNISGGTFSGQITSANANPSFLVGNVNFTVTGGDFSMCSGIVGNVDGYSKIDISGHSEAASIKGLITDFDEMVTSSGVEKPKSVVTDFLSGSFTDSNGTTIPYRYYIPENYDAQKKYPVFLYMHGNGSRGSDNEIHLTTNGAALNTKVFSSDYECIMIAPQCPLNSAWVDTSRYPGTDLFNETTDMGKHLNAAKELLDKFLADYSVDTQRIYITGSSNGGAATWELIYRYPNMFAAAVPMAGTGYFTGAAELGKHLTTTPITTFHGDADLTLSVIGTRTLVEQIRNAGGTNVTYTEFAGADHNIWMRAANTPGLVDWIFSQVNDSYSPDERDYSLLDNGEGNVTDVVTDNSAEDITTNDSGASTDSGTDVIPDTDKDAAPTSIFVIVGIAAAVVVAVVVVVIIIKKKKN